MMYTEKWMKASGLECGTVYLTKDGKVLMYLGTTPLGRYVFYVFASAWLVYRQDDDGTWAVTYGNYDSQVYGIRHTIRLSMENKGTRENILEYKTMPKIYGEFPSGSCKDRCLTWYRESFQGMDVPVVDGKKRHGAFMRVKDLVPGCLYYNGSCWDSTYVYLGRASDGRFLWYHVISGETLKGYDAARLVAMSEYTGTNRRVLPLSAALDDSDALVNADTMELITSGYRVDMEGVTQVMLDTRGQRTYPHIGQE